MSPRMHALITRPATQRATGRHGTRGIGEGAAALITKEGPST